ncbi:MAG: hypothetical protein MJZ89_04245 [Paludibacteraceae bacterium]|nr:hypothetical protein [Paludibacteraceae bacterium]
MDLDEYTQLLESPSLVEETQVQDLQALLQRAPYCASARLLLLKALFESNDPRFADIMDECMLMTPPEVSVYFLLQPKKTKAATKKRNDKPTDAHGEHSISYFEMVERMQQVANKTGLTFEELTKRYLETRQYTK